MNKIYILLLTLLISIPFIYAQSDEKIINNQELTNLIKVNPQDAMTKYPSQSIEYLNGDTKFLKTRMQDPDFLNEFEQIIINQPNLINKNPEVKKEWFSNMGIEDKGISISSYDGSNLILSNNNDVKTITISNLNSNEIQSFLKGAISNEDGSLLLSDGTLIKQGKIDYKNGIALIQKGEIDFKDFKGDKSSLYLSDSIIKLDHQIIRSNKIGLFEYSSEEDNENIIVSGKEIEVEFDDGKKWDVNGKIEVNSNTNQLIFYDNTDASKFIDGSKVYNFKTDKKIELVGNTNDCKLNNCIIDQNGNLNLKVNNNDLDLNIYDNMMKQIDCDKIDDDSVIKISSKIEGKEPLIFTISKNNPTVEGNLKFLNFDIKSKFINKYGEEHEMIFDDEGGLVYCSNCIECGSVSEKVQKKDYDKFVKKYKKDFGVKPIELVSFIDEIYKPDERELLIDFVEAAKHVGVKPSFLISAFMQEGGIVPLLEEDYNPNYIMDTYGDMGVDSLVTELNNVVASGYLPKDFSDKFVGNFEDTVHNENGMLVKIKDLKMKDMITGLAGLYAWMKNYATDKGNNENYIQLNKEEKYFVNYLLFNWGQENVKKLLDNNDLTSVKNFIHKYQNSDTGGQEGKINTNKYFNAGRTAGGAMLLDEYIFNNDRLVEKRRRENVGEISRMKPKEITTIN